MVNCMHLHERDNVLVALETLNEGVAVSTAAGHLDGPGGRVTARSAVPFAHKIARCAIMTGETVFKYGEPIGAASVDIAPGDHVHIHNIRSLRVAGEA